MSNRHDAERLLADLLAAGAIPVLDNGKLRIEAPAKTLNPGRHQALRGCLTEIRALIETRWRPREECIAKRPCRRMSVCQEPEVDGWPCLLPRICALCKIELQLGRRYLR